MQVRGRQGEDRIFTIPNALSIVRLACIPVFVWLLAQPAQRYWYPAALLLGALGITDFLDGYAARHLGQVSTLGKVLDPLVDRLLLGVAAVSTVVVGAIPLAVAVPALAREVLVAAGALIVVAAGGRRIDVVWAGKAGTFGLMVALPLFLIGHANDDWKGVAEFLGWGFSLPALVLGWYAAITYIPLARSAVAEARATREAREARA